MAKIQNITSVFFLFIICFAGYAQTELNPYKYIIVPKQYDFLKEENQYRVNSMTKYLFEQNGFRTLYQGDEYPADLNANPCLAATAIVLNESSAFTTKLVIALKDCRDKEVYRTAEGKSKIKEFEKTYVDALKKAFIFIENLNYSFDESMVINAEANAMIANEKQEVIVETPAIEKEEEKSIESAVVTVPAEKSTPKTSPAAAAAVPVAVSEKPKEQELKVVESSVVADPAAEGTKGVSPVAVAAIPVVVAEKPKEEEPVKAVAAETVVVSEQKSESPKLSGGARAFKNQTTTFLLVDQGAQMQAFVSESKNKNYSPGELIGTFKKTSLPNVFRVSWKKPQKDIDETTAYFDEQGNLKIDILRNDKIEVLTLVEVK